MSKPRTGPRAFRPWPQVEPRLEYADKAGINVSEILNELLVKYGKNAIEEKVRNVRKVLEAPVP